MDDVANLNINGTTYSIKDAAALFGVSNQTLRKRLQRGRSLLKGMLEHE